jgi:hypothetical protein
MWRGCNGTQSAANERGMCTSARSQIGQHNRTLPPHWVTTPPQYTTRTSGDLAAAQARACSLPPSPTTATVAISSGFCTRFFQKVAIPASISKSTRTLKLSTKILQLLATDWQSTLHCGKALGVLSCMGWLALGPLTRVKYKVGISSVD